jgi:hypothetical protein
MEKTAVEWLLENLNSEPYSEEEFNYNKECWDKALEMEKEQSYTYDEIRTIAYNAYCLGQLNEPTEGKYNLWIQQYKKK